MINILKVNHGALLSEHKTSWLWVFRVGIWFFIPAIFCILTGILELTYEFESTGSLFGDYFFFIVAGILLILSIAAIRPFRGIVFEDGFLYGSSLRLVNLRFDEVESVQLEEVEFGEHLDGLDGLVVGLIGGLFIWLFIGKIEKRRAVIYKKDGSIIKLMKSREKNYSKFIDELDSFFTSKSDSSLTTRRRKRLRQRRNG